MSESVTAADFAVIGQYDVSCCAADSKREWKVTLRPWKIARIPCEVNLKLQLV